MANSALTLGLYTTIFSTIFGVLALVGGAFLLKAYARTRISGLLWLLLAIVVWPILIRISFPLFAMAMRYGSPSAQILGMPAAYGMIVLQTALSSLVSGALIVTACVLLDRQLTAPLPAYAASAPVSYAGVTPKYPYTGEDRR